MPGTVIEREMILHPNARFKVLHVDKLNGHVWVDLIEDGSGAW